MGTILRVGVGGAGALVGLTALAGGCASETVDNARTGPQIVATTSILGDVTQEVVGDQAEVGTLMPAGADPHSFELSTREAEDLLDADLLIVNGAGFEEGLLDTIDRAEASGVEIFSFADHVDVLEAATGDREEDHDEGHDDHEQGSVDPHLWTDPARMAQGTEALGAALTEVDGLDPVAVEESTSAYLDELAGLDSEMEDLLAAVPDRDRILVTNHEVFGYFADRYDFAIAGTVLPSTSTLADAAPAQLEDLRETIRDRGIPAIFVESTGGSDEAGTLARSLDDVEIVELYSESLGREGSGAGTYIGMMRTNARRIAGALA